MTFPDVTIAGRAAKLLLIAHDWARSVTIEHTMRALIDEGVEGLESRRARSTTPLHTLRMKLTIDGAAADAWRKGIADLTTQFIAVPIPVDILPKADLAEAIYNGAAQWANYDPDTGDHAIVAATALPEDPTELAHPWIAPLLVGRLKKRPEHDMIVDDESIALEIDLHEDSPWSCRVSCVDLSPAWSAEPDWSEDPVEVSELGLEIASIGLTRESVLDRANSPPRWRQRASFVFDGRDEIRSHLAYWINRRGPVKAWDGFPAWCRPGTDTDDTPHDMRVRFAGEKLALTYHPVDGWLAECEVSFLQEVAFPGIGDPDQETPTRCHLLRLTYECSPWAANVIERYADWDAPIEIAGDGTYQPWPMVLKAMRRSVELQHDDVEIRWAWADSTLLAFWVRQWSDFPVRLELLECRPDDLDRPLDSLYSAHIATVDPDGAVLTVRASLLGGALKRRVPPWLFQAGCNAVVFDANCGLAKETYRSIAHVIWPTNLINDGATLVLQDITGWMGPGAPEAHPSHMFARGWCVLQPVDADGDPVANVVAGAAPILRQIRGSGAGAGGHGVDLVDPIDPARLPVATYRVQVFPGCSGRLGAAGLVGTCKWFGNELNHGGYPHVPDYIPQRVLSPTKAGK